jgi:heme exporter protein D
LISNGFLMGAHPFYRVFFWVQVALHVLSGIALLLQSLGVKHKLLSFPAFILLTNAAQVAGLFRWMRGTTQTKWKTVDRE